MVFFRSFSLHAFLLLAATSNATPIRDLSTDTIRESHCDWPNFNPDDDLDGVMVLYRGHKLAEWRNENNGSLKDGTTQHPQYSVTKTWISVLVGMLYRDGFLDWETEHPNDITLGDIFADEGVWDEMWDIPYIFHGGSKVEELKKITLGELMSMRTGYSESWFGSPLDSNLVRDLDGLAAWWHPLYRAGAIESQTCFKCGNYLSTSGIVNYIIKEKTKTASNPDGWDPLDYARQTSSTLPNGNIGLFEALGMEQGSYTWDRDTDGVARAAYGLWLDLEDMAKFGQLLLQEGMVSMNGRLKNVVPSAYVAEMSSVQSRMTGSMAPYGWQVWTWGEDDDGDSGFCAEGLGWQSICVFPKDEMIVAMQATPRWGFDAFIANIETRKEAVKKIRNGISCSPTNSPTTSPGGQPTISTPAPSSSTVVGDNLDTDNGNGNNNNNEEDTTTDNDNSRGSSLNFAKEEEGGSPTGLIVALVLALLVIMALACLLFGCGRKKKEEEKANARSIDAFCKVIDDDGDKVVDVDLDDVSKGSVDTDDESAEAAAYVEADDLEQRSSTRSTTGSSYV